MRNHTTLLTWFVLAVGGIGTTLPHTSFAQPPAQPPARPIPTAHPDDIFWEPGPSVMGIDHWVFALTEYDGQLIAAGRFDAAGGTIARKIAAWDGTSWSALGAGLDGSVKALTVFDGRLIAAGFFGDVVAAWDGTSWSPLGPGTPGDVNGLAVVEGQLIAGCGSADGGVAVWDGIYWTPLGLGIPGTVYALAVYDNRLIAAGYFTEAGGVPANSIAAWDGSSWSALGTGVGGVVRALAVYDGQLIAGGGFTSAGGTAVNYAAAWDGSSWSPLGAGLDDYVRSLVVDGGVLIAGGEFEMAGGAPANRIAAWDGSTWYALGTGMDRDVNSLWVYQGELVAGGQFGTAGGTAAVNIASWDHTTWHPMGTGSNGSVLSLTVYGDSLVAGGGFVWIDGVAANRVASWDGVTWSPLGAGVDATVTALDVYDDQLVAAGWFTAAGGAPAGHIAAWDGASWSPLGSGVIGAVHSPTLTVWGDDLIAGSSWMDEYNNETISSVSAWDGTSWTHLGTFTDYSWGAGWVFSVAVYGGQLYVGGSFNRVEKSGSPAVWVQNVAVFDGAAWSNPPWGPIGDGNFVHAMAVYDDKLVVAGWGIVATWDGTTWTSIGSELGVEAVVRALAVLNDRLIAGGDILTAEGAPGENICAWDGSEWGPLGSGVNSTVNALTVHNDQLIVGGNFTTAGDKVSAYLARWNDPAVTAVSVTGFQARAVDDGIELTWGLAADERIEGFRLYRSCGGQTSHLLNTSLIDASARRYFDETALAGQRYQYTLAVVGEDSGEIRSETIEAELPALALQLYPNRPNPFNPVTSIRYVVPRASRVTLRVYAASGELVRTLVDANRPAGPGEVSWDGTNDDGAPVASGVYLCRLRAGSFVQTRKMTLLK